MDDTTNSATNSANGEQAHGSRKIGLALLFVVVLAGGAGLWRWYAKGADIETTDNAYVSGDLVQVTSEIAGTAIAVHADDTQSIERDQLLVELDPVDARLALDSAEAELARVVRQVRGLFAEGQQLRAQIAERETVLKRVQDDFSRRRGLVRTGAVSAEDLSHSQDAVTQARAALIVAQEQLNAALVQTQGTTVATHPHVMQAAAVVRNAALTVQRTRLTAPIDGVVARRSIQIGQRIAAGTPLLTIVPLQQVWVDANFREVQLARLRVGQPVRLSADIYGKRVEYHGRLAGLSAGSGSAFALLPAQNASGNWIKIVQRVPVRIALDAIELKAHPLRVGLSMKVAVDVRDTSGSLVATQVRAAAAPSRPSLEDDPLVARQIATIIAQNNIAQGSTTSLNAAIESAALLPRLPGAASVAIEHPTANVVSSIRLP